MKTSGHLILYISENEDFELWRVLSQISPDDRAAFVKSALKKSLFSESENKNNYVAADYPIKNSQLRPQNNSMLENPINNLAMEEVVDFHRITDEEREVLNSFTGDKDDESLDVLQLDDLLQSSETVNTNSIPGLNFLLSNVIGEEQDEGVIEYIRNNTMRSDNVE